MQSILKKNQVLIALFVFSVLVLYSLSLCRYEMNRLFYFGVDWRDTFYPALKLFLQGKNPYLVTTMHNPVWVLIPLIPFAWLGEPAGEIAIFFAAFVAYVYVALKLHASPVTILLLMASPLIVYNLMLGNVDWLVGLGFVMPPTLGLFFVMLKPQIGIAVAAYWLWISYKNGGMRNVIKIFSPVTISLAVSFMVFGNWLTDKSDHLLSAYWNMSLFPYSVPIGLTLFFMARKKMNYAVSASPFFSPYLSVGSWSIVQLGIVDNKLLTFATTIGLWVVYILVSHVR